MLTSTSPSSSRDQVGIPKIDPYFRDPDLPNFNPDLSGHRSGVGIRYVIRTHFLKKNPESRPVRGSGGSGFGNVKKWPKTSDATFAKS